MSLCAKIAKHNGNWSECVWKVWTLLRKQFWIFKMNGQTGYFLCQWWNFCLNWLMELLPTKRCIQNMWFLFYVINFMPFSNVLTVDVSYFTPFAFTALVNFLQPVYVSRNDPNSRLNTIKEIKRRCKPNSGWPQIVIFPEGTCTNRSCLISFKGGKFKG